MGQLEFSFPFDQREWFNSRLGFILVSAGCAIGIGNVWRFPYVVGENGGAIFVLFYLFFLVIMGVPALTMEFAVGRASGRTTMKGMKMLEKKDSSGIFTDGSGMPAVLS